jgi:D-3-phosphoglycerate dehydrogenase / 2-oxoglutarate reductase
MEMKAAAYPFSCARWPVLDEQSLVEALQQKQLAGAALDVLEPQPRDHPLLVSRT